jgi:hypothetical protein
VRALTFNATRHGLPARPFAGAIVPCPIMTTDDPLSRSMVKRP